MEIFKLREKDEFIKLGQLLKALNMVESGVDAKIEITEGNVTVNNEICTQRGKKLYDNDVVEFDGNVVKISK